MVSCALLCMVHVTVILVPPSVCHTDYHRRFYLTVSELKLCIVPPGYSQHTLIYARTEYRQLQIGLKGRCWQQMLFTSAVQVNGLMKDG